MSVLRGRNMRLLSLLAILPIALACYYEQVGMELPLPYCMRACQLECSTREKGDSVYAQCCTMIPLGQEAPAICSEAAATGPTTCDPNNCFQTTDSAGYTAPSTYATAQPTAPVTSMTEGQSISSETGVVTEWTTTTVSADCAPTAPPETTTAAPVETSSSETSSAPTDTCECTETAQPTEAWSSSSEYPESSSTTAPAETSNTEGESYASEVYGGSPPPEGYQPEDRKKKRTWDEKQYTCACAAPSDTSVSEGMPYSSEATSAIETTSSSTSCTDGALTSDVYGGNAPPEGYQPENERRFLPPIYGPGPAITPAPAQPNKRTYDTESSAEGDSGAAQTVTSTKTETAPCSGDAAAPGATDYPEGDGAETDCEEGEEPAETSY